MNILIYSDCMSIGPETVPEHLRYGGIIQSELKQSVVSILGYSGQTSIEGCNTIDEAKKGIPDIIILGWGVNDALPRGLKRETRSKIIKGMYKLGLNEKQRLLVRSLFLNPLEYLCQLVHNPFFYLSLEATKTNFEFMIDSLKGQSKILVLSIAPVLNYRFINANEYINKYNRVIKEVCEIKDAAYIDIYSEFLRYGVSKCLDSDGFHYSAIGHELVSRLLSREIDKWK